jgi:membrane-bound lytic murein transglycosylase D
MRSIPLAIALMLALSGCAELEIREDESESQAARDTASNTLTEHDELYRLTPRQPTYPVTPPSNDAPTPDYGLWTRLARGFTMYSMVHDRIDEAMFLYLGRLDQLQTITQRAEPYLFFIVEQLRERGMPMELALLPIVESAYQPGATSRSKAAGLWQFIPSTGQHFGLKQNWWYDGRRDVHASTQAALDYLQRLHDMFAGDWLLALSAYNAGEGTVSRAIERAAARGEPTDYWSLDLPQETKDYVPRLIALSRLFHDPHVYGLIPHKIEDAPFLARIELDRPLNLSKVANAMEMSEEELYRLNPGFKRGINGNGKEAIALLLPRDKAQRLKEMDMEDLYAALPKLRQAKATRTESAASFARRHGVSLTALREMNPLLQDKVTRGQIVLLPAKDGHKARDTKLAQRQPEPSLAKTADKRQDHRQATTKITYTVRKGDTLFGIARRFKVDVARLRQWNKLGEKDALKPGQDIIVALTGAPDQPS